MNLDTALRPLRHSADFSGRSTRTELIAFWLLTVAVGALMFLSSIAFGVAAVGGIWLIFQLAIFCPTVALFVRRLHDSGRSAWWLLLVAPAFAAGVYDRWNALGAQPLYIPDRPLLVELLLAASGIPLMVLLLWNDDPNTNTYGPNPRLPD